MSSPPNSQGDTPTTTPPAPASSSNTPVPEPAAASAPQEDAMEVDEEEGTHLTLPISKIKRIFKMDPEYSGASSAAVFATGVATELFIQYFAEQASVMAKLENRKKITYKDFSTVVSTQDSLHFLGDTVPRTVPLATVLQKAKEQDEDIEDVVVEEPQEQKKIDIKDMLPISKPDDKPKKSLITDLMDNSRESTVETTENES